MHVAWVVVEKEHQAPLLAVFPLFHSSQLPSLPAFAALKFIISITIFSVKPAKEILFRGRVFGTARNLMSHAGWKISNTRDSRKEDSGAGWGKWNQTLQSQILHSCISFCLFMHIYLCNKNTAWRAGASLPVQKKKEKRQ
jgi:hypothetical protein